MKVLMLGWEYPPHISGGLGTACEGLSKALSYQNIKIDFIVPQVHGGENADHMSLIDTTSINNKSVSASSEIPGLRQLGIPAHLQPYMRPEQYSCESTSETKIEHKRSDRISVLSPVQTKPNKNIHYGQNIFDEVARYAQKIIQSFQHTAADVIHAHDWMTFPAGVALSKLTGKPLVIHIHSLESDRSGQGVNSQIHEIEKMASHFAHRIITVSNYTANLVVNNHGVSREKIKTVHNGVMQDHYGIQNQPDIKKTKNVLFLGRVTFQKGPDYFVEAAAKVIPHVPDAKFILAGSGDMLGRMIERVAELGLSKNFSFPGFVIGDELKQIYASADLYVMPSVSEPFGIAPLEAINHNTPVLLSKQSGVGEVINHALKFDFWDVNRLAELIIAALNYEEIRQDLLAMSQQEVRRIRWENAAHKTIQIYNEMVN